MALKVKKFILGEPYTYHTADRSEIKGRLVNDIEIQTNKGNIFCEAVAWPADHTIEETDETLSINLKFLIYGKIQTPMKNKEVLEFIAKLESVSTDARWNGPVLEAYRLDKWETVSNGGLYKKS